MACIPRPFNDVFEKPHLGMPDAAPVPSLTAPAAPSLAARTVGGAAWMIIWRLTTRALGLVSTIIMVRLLSPADFGLIALATSCVVAIDAAANMGVAESLVREKEVDGALYNTGFTLNAIRGVLMGGGIALSAAPAAAFFGDPRLATILYILAGVSFISTIENPGIVDFRRSLAFEKEFMLSAVPRFAGVAASIIAAFILRNYWALIAGVLARAILRFGLTYWMHPFRPRFMLRSWRRIIAFSFWTWLGTMGMIARERLDSFVIGRVLGPVSVGVYSVGWEIGALTSTELVEPLTTALFAGFSAAHRTGSNVGEGYFKAIALTLLVTLPAGVGLSAIADPVVRLAFGPQWMEAVPLVQVFALLCMVKVIAYFSTVLFNAAGLIHVQVRVLYISLVVRAVLLFALIHPLGMTGAVIAAIASVAVEELLFLVITFRRFKLRPIDLLRDIWRSMLAAAAMAAVLRWQGIGWLPTPGSSAELGSTLAIAVASGAATYGAVLLLLWLICGRPDGAERSFIQLVGGTLQRLISRRRAVVS